MRNASTETQEVQAVTRATFEVPTDLYEAFKRAAKQNDQTCSQEIRRFIREYVATDERAAA